MGLKELFKCSETDESEQEEETWDDEIEEQGREPIEQEPEEKEPMIKEHRTERKFTIYETRFCYDNGEEDVVETFGEQGRKWTHRYGR